MFPLFKRRDSSVSKTIFLVDISSGSVGCGLAELKKNGPPVLLLSEREPVTIGHDRSAKELLSATAQALKKTTGRLQAAVNRSRARGGDRHMPPSAAAVFLHAPWTDIFLRNLRFARPNPFPVSPSTLERMMREYVRTEHPPHAEQEIIERTALGIRLNGYTVEEVPSSGSVSSVEFTLLSVAAPKDLQRIVRDIVQDVLRASATFHSSLVASAYAFATLNPQEETFLSCTVGAETTELLLVQEGVSAGSATVPVGTELFMRTLGTHGGLHPKERKSALRLAKHEDSPMRKKMTGALAAASKEYAAAFSDAAAALIQDSGAVPVLAVLCDEPAGEHVRAALEASSFVKTSPGGMDVRPLIVPHKALRGQADLFLEMLAIFADARFDEGKTLTFSLS